MIFTLASLLFLAFTPAVNQKSEAPTFLIETASGLDGSPLGGCEVLVLQEAMLENEEDIARFYQHGLELAEHLEERGTQYTTDASGKLKIPVPAGDFMISASHGSGLVGYRGWVNPQFKGHQKIFLLEPRVAEVRCLDAHGKPIVGLPVVMSPIAYPLPLIRKLTDTTGRVRFTHLGLYETAAEQMLFADLQLSVAIPLQDDLRVPIAETLTTGAPFDFVLPPLGAVEVEIPAGWRPRGNSRPVISLKNVLSGSAPMLVPMPNERISATVMIFPYVGLNQTLTVALLDSEQDANVQKFQGPVEPNQIVKVTLDLPMPLSGWRIRALTSGGEVISNAHFSGLFVSRRNGGGGAQEVEFHSDEEGYIDLPILVDQPQVDLHELLLRLTHKKHSQRLESRIDARNLAETGLDKALDVTFEAPHVFASGQVVDATGTPIVGATLFMILPSNTAYSQPWWTAPRIFNDHVKTNENGRFSIWSHESRGKLRITVSRGGYDDGAVDVKNGQTDVRIVMKRRGEVAGQVLLDDHVSPYWLNIGLSSKKNGNKSEQLDRMGRFRFGAVRNGDAKLKISSLNGFLEFYSIDLQMREGRLLDETGVREIDLRGKIFPIIVSVKLLDGQECDGFTIRPKDAGFNPRCSAWGDSWALLLDEIPADLEISKPGYRTATLTHVVDDIVVEMEPGPQVEVSLDHPEWIPDGWSLTAYFTSPKERSNLKHQINPTGKTVFALSDPGQYSVRLMLRGPNHLSRGTVCEMSFKASATGNTRLELQLDEMVIREAVEE